MTSPRSLESASAALVSPLFANLKWLEHGFGTRHSQIDQDAMASLKQVHSAKVLPVSEIGCAGEADSLITTIPGVAVSVRTADCFPILLADPEQRAIGAVHAGWRGTAEHIVERALEQMRTDFGTRPANILAAIGPGIGRCCYQVGEEVARRFGFEGAAQIDLAGINREQLIAAGVGPSQIDTIGGCTFCESQQFFSYRREKENAGRMISYARIRG